MPIKEYVHYDLPRRGKSNHDNDKDKDFNKIYI